MSFCTQCGHKNVAEARFCEECGTPLVKPAASASAPVAVPDNTAGAPRPINGKLLKFAAISVVVLIAIGAGLFFLLAPESPNNARFAAAIERSLAANAQNYKSRYCLSNFAYQLDPVLVNDGDQNTRQWLSVLTKAGLYSEPELIEDTTGFFVVRKLRYTKTEAGKKATLDRQLCIAEGVSVAKVDSFTQPEKLGDTQASRARVTLKLRNPMPWVMDEETLSIAPQIKAEFSDSVVMVLKEGKWDVADQGSLQAAMAAQRTLEMGQKAHVRAATSGGIFDALKNLFSFGASNPIVGHWKSEMMGMTVASFTFDADSMEANGQKTKVRYEIEDKRVTVYPQDQGAGMIVNVIDHDTLSINTGLVEIKLKRAN